MPPHPARYRGLMEQGNESHGGSAAGVRPGKSGLRQAGGSTLSKPRRLNAEVLAAAGQLKPGTIEALLRSGPDTGLGA
jgi:hypothetical protein